MENTLFIEKSLDEINIDELKDRENFVVYSGGLDSNLILYSLAKKLQDLQFENLYGISVFTTYFDKDMHDIESRKRLNFIDFLYKKFNRFIKLRNINIDYGQIIEIISNSARLKFNNCVNEYGDPRTFILIASSLIQLSNINKINLFLGFNADDTRFLRYMHEWSEIFKALSIILNKDIKIYVPLINKQKTWIIQDSIDNEIFEYASSCENVKSYLGLDQKPCGRCNSCLLEIKSLIIIYKYDNTGKYSKFAYKRLKEVFNIDMLENNIADSKEEEVTD